MKCSVNRSDHREDRSGHEAQSKRPGRSHTGEQVGKLCSGPGDSRFGCGRRGEGTGLQ